MRLSVVRTSERPDLAQQTGLWRWDAFYKTSQTSLADVLARDAATAATDDLMPAVLVLLEDQQPIGMVAICLDDLDDRPEHNPWLAGLYVEPEHRGKGHAMRLIAELEALARAARIGRLSLYTANAVGLYEKAGWTVTETFEKKARLYSIMQKHL